MDVLVAVAVLLPLIVLLLLVLAITVHFFWLAHQGRWPPTMTPGAGPSRPAAGL